MQILLMRLKAPLMSFGDIDASEELGPTMRHPAKSMIAGLIANAMGFAHYEPERTQALQDAIEIASLELKAGEIVADLQTARLGYGDVAWTTDGRPMERAGHKYSYRGAQRRRKEYIAGGDYVVAIRADPALLEEIAAALKYPARPLFIGRRSCLPTRSPYMRTVEATSLIAALKTAGHGHARWPAGEPDAPAAAIETNVADLRDWTTRLHGGRRSVAEGQI